MNTVLITGANGFIGSTLMKLFISKGYRAEGWDLKEGSVNNGHFVLIDLENELEVLENIKRLRPDIIIHCAGSADVNMSIQYPELDFRGNVVLTHNMLFAIHKAGLDKSRFLLLSSAAVYGNPIQLPIKENVPLNPLSPYAVHKVMCDELCMYFARNYNMNIKIARIFSAYGAGLKKQIFWDMYNKAKKSYSLEMYGTGNESRDYIHVKDVVQSLFLLATSVSDDIVFNVANGEELTIRRVTELFADSAGIERSKIIFKGVGREGDPLNWKADVGKIKALGYKKSIEMEQGLKEYVQWVKNQ